MPPFPPPPEAFGKTGGAFGFGPLAKPSPFFGGDDSGGITGVNVDSPSAAPLPLPAPGPAPLPPAFIPTSATSTTTQQGVDLPFGSQEFLSSSEQARAALLAQAKAKAAQAQQEAAVALQAPAERDAIAADADAARADVESQISRVQADLARMTAEAERETPPPRLSLGQQADLERAAEAAGRAMGFMMQGGANPALVIADRLINQQIQQQKGRAAGKARIRAEKRSFLATLTARLGREDAAEALAYKRLAANQADMLKGIAASSQDPVLKAGAEVTAAQLEQRAMQAGNQAAALMADKSTVTTKRGVQSTRGGKLDKDSKNKIRAAVTSTAREERFINDLRKMRGTTAGRKFFSAVAKAGGAAGELSRGALESIAARFPGTDAARLLGQRGEIISLHVKALSGVTARPDEIARIDPNYPSFFDSEQQIASKLAGRLNERRQELMAILQTDPGSKQTPLIVSTIKNLTTKIKAQEKLARAR